MADIGAKLRDLYSLEELAQKSNIVTRRNTFVKLLVTIWYLVCVLSVDVYDVERLAAFFLYPFLLIAWMDIPYRVIFRRTCVALPFVLFAGCSNLLLDHRVWGNVYGLVITGGVVSFVTLLCRTFLCVSAVLIFVAATPLLEISGQLRRCHVPEILVMLFEMTYRYLGVLVEEASTMVNAYRLRSNGRKWPQMSEFGSLVGGLLLRSMMRAERVYHAMQCRLYPGIVVESGKNHWNWADVCFLFGACGLTTLFRLVSVAGLFGRLLENL